ncbi:hypothetical protein JCM33374_g3530 [Metschnikowia sp. JCM 33374]|nr:hypothetical protein JCM33374_g3530 [Metschnikowia sp. JCM 33374]
MSNHKYGIVIDSGSSGSRIQIYRWDDVAQARESASAEVLGGPPSITQQDGWSKKISPGISSFAGKHKGVWKAHYKQLFQFAEKIIPADKIPETPVYILSTAGMRLIPEEQRQAILTETCNSVQRNTKFFISNCEDHVQTIDGSTEGVYGWLALNYLMSSFQAKPPGGKPPKTVGFMDMGGASTQIAFVPAADQIEKHDEDLSTVTLRSIDGTPQKWRVFVETWLGFGANQGRSRYLNNLISLAAASSPGSRRKVVSDPCMPTGSMMRGYQYENKKYKIEGTGNYEACLRGIYPLLMKHLPCSEEPCLFNGIHGPKMDFEADKFVGVSEYWYTANDIFHSGGEYNFHSFNAKVKDFCESKWMTILSNSKNGDYSNLPEEYLLDACFKASWVINVLHEGFGLPRLALDIEDGGKSHQAKEAEAVHVPFKSAESVDGKELSWTLGKMLLVASSQIEASDNLAVGVVPSAISQRLLDDPDTESDDESVSGGSNWVFHLVLYVAIVYFIYRVGKKLSVTLPKRKHTSWQVSPVIKGALSGVRGKLPRFCASPINRIIAYMELQEQADVSMELEEGNTVMSSQSRPGSSVLRTRSTINFAEDAEDTKRPLDFMSKPFANPKNSPFYNHVSDSRDSLSKSLSSGSTSRLQN